MKVPVCTYFMAGFLWVTVTVQAQVLPTEQPQKKASVLTTSHSNARHPAAGAKADSVEAKSQSTISKPDSARISTPAARPFGADSIAWYRDRGDSCRWYHNVQAQLGAYQRAAEADDPHAEFQMARMFQIGEGVEMDLMKASDLYNKSLPRIRAKAEQGDTASQIDMGNAYQYGFGVDKDTVQAFTWYHKAASGGNPVAEYYIGLCYQFGVGVVKDPNTSAVWMRKAGDHGFIRAMESLGRKLQYGFNGYKKDSKEALFWLKKAAYLKDVDGQTQLGDFLEYDSTYKDLAQACYWYKQSAMQGYPHGEYELGRCYEYGIGVDRSYEQAANWYEKATESGDNFSAYCLGRLYSKGDGVALDNEKAKSLFRKACDHKIQDACTALQSLQ